MQVSLLLRRTLAFTPSVCTANSSALGEKAVIGSALGAPGSEIYKLACGEALVHEALYLDVNMENGVGIHFTDLTPADVQARVLAIYEKMVSGEIEVQP